MALLLGKQKLNHKIHLRTLSLRTVVNSNSSLVGVSGFSSCQRTGSKQEMQVIHYTRFLQHIGL
jgi:hypothetical protein